MLLWPGAHRSCNDGYVELAHRTADDVLARANFAFEHRYEAGRRWLLEIVGFWTPDYLEAKLRSYREARIERFILCIDERRACADSDVPTGAQIVRFRDRMARGRPRDPGRVLDEEKTALARTLHREGTATAVICATLGISRSSLYRYLPQPPAPAKAPSAIA